MLEAMGDLTVNGRRYEVAADDDTPLLYVLRNHLALKGTRFGCGVGLCGACFVLADGRPIYSCDTPLWSVADKSIPDLRYAKSLHSLADWNAIVVDGSLRNTGMASFRNILNQGESEDIFHYVISQANAKIDARGRLADELVSCRNRNEFML